MFSYPTVQLKKLTENEDFIDFVSRSERVQTDYRGDLRSEYHIHDSQSLAPESIQKKVRRKMSLGQGCQTLFTKDSIYIKNASVTLLTKKYTQYVLSIYGENGKINLKGFLQMAGQNKGLMSGYFTDFSKRLWKCDPSTKMPYFVNEGLPRYDCTLTMIKQKRSGTAFFLALENCFCFYKPDESPKQILPFKVVFLKGLVVNRLDKLTYQFKHVHNIYESFKLLIQQHEEQPLDKIERNLDLLARASDLAKYRFEDKIGSGNYSVVYRCRSKQSGEAFAAKVIEKFKLKVEERELIIREISVMQILEHKNVIKVYDIFNHMNEVILILELVHSGDLKSFIFDHRRLSERLAAQVFGQLLDTLIYFKQVGLLHRDLKPDNIMLSVDCDRLEKFKIIDFGFSVYEYDIHRLSKELRMVGTPNYIAPEILLDQPYDYEADLFSAAVILFEMVSGDLPFDHPLIEEVFNNIKACDYCFSAPCWAIISKECKDLISSVLVRDPKKRPSPESLKKHPWLLQAGHA